MNSLLHDETQKPFNGGMQFAPQVNQRSGNLKRASINLRLRMRLDFLRAILGAPGEIHLSQTLRASVCHFVRQPFLNDEFLHALTSERG